MFEDVFDGMGYEVVKCSELPLNFQCHNVDAYVSKNLDVFYHFKGSKDELCLVWAKGEHLPAVLNFIKCLESE